MLELSLLSLLAIAIVVITTLRLPIADIKAVRHDNVRLALSHPGGTELLRRDAPLTIAPQGGAPITLRADTLIDGIVAQGSRAQNRLWWQKRDAVARALAAGPVTVRFADGRSFVATSRARRLGDLTGGFWAALATGLAGLLCGLSILVLRPRNNAARTFAVMSVGLFGVGCTLAAGYDPLLLGDTYRLLMLVNHACVQIFSAAILMLFCRFPTPLVPRFLIWSLGIAAVVLTIIDVADLAADTIAMLFASIIVEFLLFVSLLIGQGWAVRKDPVGSAAMRLIGLSAIISSALLVAMVILPMLIAGAPLISDAIALPLLLVIYAGLGAAIARHRLFTVDGWAPGMLLSVSAAIAVTAVDLAILALAAGSQGIALPIAIVAVALIYLPLRQAITRRVDRRRNAAAQHGLRLASEIAFALTSQERAVRWRSGLEETFDPLEVADDPAPGTLPSVAEDGVALRLPRIGDMPGLILRYAQRGARDFDAIDVAQAREVIDAIAALMGARDSYVRGVAEERARITQDLHDDVSARLLTSLHREDANMMRRDVREAMADIRAIVTSGGDAWRVLDDVIADLRFETTNRLEAHGIAVDWPLETIGLAGQLVDSGTTRHLISIVRELTSNIVRHAGAGHVAVDISIAASQLSLRLRDNGVGVDPASDWGNGLTNIARRAALLNGAFQIREADGGTMALLEIRLMRDERPADVIDNDNRSRTQA
ncbi:MAG: hypothetical protein KF730_17400 [Sphingomonas sp.]|uniref:sensor histidine kinase n=1 Tax=Sphingomonas sp. TaxID=28214 RepID=UPI0025DFFC75|nr:ATP-binding protein [Sphingomonas sp.]MBX3566337.1 hypothetical protein [Sphingomonas sp.]